MWSSGLSVSGDGVGVVAYAGSVGLRLLADGTGLTTELSKAMSRRSPRSRPGSGAGRRRGHARRWWRGDRRHRRPAPPSPSPGPGRVATHGVAHPGRGHLGTVEEDRHRACPGPPPTSGHSCPAGCLRPRSPGPTSAPPSCWTWTPRSSSRNSEKEQASATFKKTFGFHPLGVWCDTPRSS